MKRTLTLAAIAATVALASPANAQSGWNFYQRCGTALTAGFLDRPYCHDYLSGFYDALAATGAICTPYAPNDTQLVVAVQNWMRNRPGYLNSPYHLMIRDALLASWGCRRRY